MAVYNFLIKKGGRKPKAGNYSPVSLTCIMGKILEYIKEVIAGYLENLSAIMQSLHGIVKRKSCLTNLLEFFE